VLDEEDEHKPVPLASNNLFNYFFKQLNLAAYVCSTLRKDPNDVGQQVGQTNTANWQQYEIRIDHVTGLIVRAKYTVQTHLSGIPAMVIAPVKPIAIIYEMLVNLFARNVVNTVQIHQW